MTKRSTLIGVYPILLIVALYGSFLRITQQGLTPLNRAVITRIAVPHIARSQTASLSFQFSKSNILAADHAVNTSQIRKYVRRQIPEVGEMLKTFEKIISNHINTATKIIYAI